MERGEQAAFLLCFLYKQELQQIKSCLRPATQLRHNFSSVSEGLKQCLSPRAVLCLLFVGKGRGLWREFPCFMQVMSQQETHSRGWLIFCHSAIYSVVIFLWKISKLAMEMLKKSLFSIWKIASALHTYAQQRGLKYLQWWWWKTPVW